MDAHLFPQSHDKEITKLRGEFEEKARGTVLTLSVFDSRLNVTINGPMYHISWSWCLTTEIEATYEKKMQMQREAQDLRHKTEIHEIEQRKSIHINTLIKNHEKAFSDIKNYYSDITLGSFNQISTLKVCWEGLSSLLINFPSCSFL